MAKSIQEIELLVTAETGKLKAELDSVNSKLDKMAGKKTQTDGFFSGFDAGAMKAGLGAAAAAAAIAVLTKGFQDMLAKEDQLADFSAITGVTGAKLQEFGNIATELSNKFGTSITQNIESFKGVLSRLGPDFAKSSEAVKMMGDSINTLAIAAGLDATQAMDALTTAMLQYGVDLKNPLEASYVAADMMNVMAAAAKEGAAEIPAISEALVVVGGVASSASVDFADLNVAIQMAAQAGIYGSEAGTQLRGIILGLRAPTTDAVKAFQDYGLSITAVQEALSREGLGGAMVELQRQLGTVADENKRVELTARLVEKSNVALAEKLMQSGPQWDAFKEKLQGTNTAQEQAAVKMDTVNAKFDIFVTKIQNVVSSGLETFLTGVKNQVVALTDFLGMGPEENASKWVQDQKLMGRAYAERAKQYAAAHPKEGQLSIDGKTVFKGGKWVEVPPTPTDTPTGGGRRKAGGAAPDPVREGIEALKRQEELDKMRAQVIGAGEAEIFAIESKSIADQIALAQSLGAKQEEIDRLTFEQKKLYMQYAIDERKRFAEIEKGIVAQSASVDVAPNEPIPLTYEASLPGADATISTLDYMNERASTFAGTLQELRNESAPVTDALTGIFADVATAAGEGSAAAKAAGIVNATIKTYEAATAAYASAAAIPVVGFILGPIAAAAAIAAGMANVSKIASMSVGTTNIPGDQMAMVHKGEAVLPRTFAEGVRSGDMALVGGGGQRRGRVRKQKVDASVHVTQFASMSEAASYDSRRMVR